MYKINRYRIFAATSCVLSIVLLISCKNNKDIENEINQLKSRPIDLCLDSLQYYSTKRCKDIDSLSFYHKNVSLVVYSDSNSCTTCGLKGLYQWYDLLSEIRDNYNDFVRVYFIFAPYEEQISELYNALETSLIDYPVFFDFNNVFAKRNKNIPTNIAMHIFLTDEYGNVIIVGSPLISSQIRKMIFEYLENRKHEINLR